MMATDGVVSATYALGTDPVALIDVFGDGKVALVGPGVGVHEWTDLPALAALRDWLNDQLAEYDRQRDAGRAAEDRDKEAAAMWTQMRQGQGP